MSKTTLLYKDVAPGADADAAFAANGAQAFSDIRLLSAEHPAAAGISAEWNAWGLDGSFTPVYDEAVAFWSAELSDGDCVFRNPPVLTIDFSQQYASVGITLVFDTASGDLCSAVNIKWFQQGELRADADFAPTAATYFCRQEVTSYDRVVITLGRTALPYRYAKLNQVIFGVHRIFGMSELRSASVVSEMNIISTELPVSTLSWTLDSGDAVDFLFQLKQPVEVRNDGARIGVFYIDRYSRSARRIYSISCKDAFGVLDESRFAGGMYRNQSAMALLEEIVDGDFPLAFDNVTDTVLTGAIEACTRREAMQQVLFAWGVCATTDGQAGIRVFALDGTPKELDEEQIYTGVSVDTASIVTKVCVTAHTYTQDESGSLEFGGVKYSETQTVYTVTNPNVTATDKQNVMEVTNATLVSAAVGQATAQRVYDYYARRNRHKGRIVWRGERLGDCVTLPNAWRGKNTGNIVRMEIALSNTVAASCETLGQ